MVDGGTWCNLDLCSLRGEPFLQIVGTVQISKPSEPWFPVCEMGKMLSVSQCIVRIGW